MKPELHMNRMQVGLYARAARKRFDALEALELSSEARALVLSLHALANGALERQADFHGTTTAALLTAPEGGDGDDSSLQSGGDKT